MGGVRLNCGSDPANEFANTFSKYLLGARNNQCRREIRDLFFVNVCKQGTDL